MTDSPNDQPVVRAAARDRVDQLRRLAIANDLLRPGEMGDFDEMLSGYLDGSLTDHAWIVLEDSTSVVLGAAYYAPEPFANRLCNLYFLASVPGRHRAGAGSALVAHVEADLRRRGADVARVLIVETSSGDGYEHARAFYGKRMFKRSIDRRAGVRRALGAGQPSRNPGGGGWIASRSCQTLISTVEHRWINQRSS